MDNYIKYYLPEHETKEEAKKVYSTFSKDYLTEKNFIDLEYFINQAMEFKFYHKDGWEYEYPLPKRKKIRF